MTRRGLVAGLVAMAISRVAEARPVQFVRSWGWDAGFTIPRGVHVLAITKTGKVVMALAPDYGLELEGVRELVWMGGIYARKDVMWWRPIPDFGWRSPALRSIPDTPGEQFLMADHDEVIRVVTVLKRRMWWADGRPVRRVDMKVWKPLPRKPSRKPTGERYEVWYRPMKN